MGVEEAFVPGAVESAHEIDDEHWKQVNHAIDLLSSVVVAGHKQESQDLAAELRCHILSLGQNDKLWQLRLSNALQQAEALRRELSKHETVLDQVQGGLDSAYAERASLIGELEMITQQLGDQETEKLCLEMEQTEQHLKEVLKGLEVLEAERASIEIESEQTELEEVLKDVELGEAESASTTTEPENAGQEQLETHQEALQVTEAAAEAEGPQHTPTEVLKDVELGEAESASTTTEPENDGKEQGTDHQEVHEVTKTEEANTCQAESPPEPRAEALKEVAEAENASTTTELENDGKEQGTDHQEVECAPDAKPTVAKSHSETAPEVKATGTFKVRQGSPGIPLRCIDMDQAGSDTLSAMEAAEAALVAAAAARQASVQQLRGDEALPTARHGAMQERVRVATRPVQASVPTCLASGSMLQSRVDPIPWRGPWGEIIHVVSAEPAERTFGHLNSVPPVPRVRETLPPARSYIHGQPERTLGSGHARTSSPLRLRETIPASVRCGGLGHVRTWSPSGLREPGGAGLGANLVPERGCQLRARSPVASVQQLSNFPDRHLEGCQTLGRFSEGPAMRNVQAAPRSIAMPAGVEHGMGHLGGSFVAPVQPLPQRIERAASFTHIGMPIQEQVGVRPMPGSPLLTYREPAQPVRTGSFVATPLGRPELQRGGSPLRMRWEKDSCTQGLAGSVRLMKPVTSEETQYVGMARISNHVRQQLPQGGVVETAAPLRTHSTKIAL